MVEESFICAEAETISGRKAGAASLFWAGEVLRKCLRKYLNITVCASFLLFIIGYDKITTILYLYFTYVMI